MQDLISRQAAIDAISCNITVTGRQNAELVTATIGTFADRIKALPSAQPEQPERCSDCEWWTNQPEIIRCKDCKHFELDRPYIIQGVPVLGHEVCTAWGDGCKTSEDGYCFLAERRES